MKKSISFQVLYHFFVQTDGYVNLIVHEKEQRKGFFRERILETI